MAKILFSVLAIAIIFSLINSASAMDLTDSGEYALSDDSYINGELSGNAQTNDQINTMELDDESETLSTDGNVDEYVNELVDVAMFNLGYLPKGDKNVTTKSSSTINSIEKILKMLNLNGIVTIVCYPGHPQGKIESVDLLDFLKKINQKEYDIVRYDFINQINNPPFAIVIESIKCCE